MKTEAHLFAVFLLIMLCSSCRSDNQEEDNAQLTKYMTGVWQSLSIKVIINSVDNSDSTHILKAGPKNWEERLQIKPIRTTFYEDSTFTSQYQNLKDSVIRTSKGKWYARNDSLFMETIASIYRYKIKKRRKSRATFTAQLDWDGDGKEDDIYRGKQEKITENSK